MNCTQQFNFTSERQQTMKAAFGDQTEIAEKIIALMSVPAELDRKKFGSSPIMHDVNTMLWHAQPKLYTGQRGTINVEVDCEEQKGKTTFEANQSSNITVMKNIMNPEILFDLLKSNIISLTGTPSLYQPPKKPTFRL